MHIKGTLRKYHGPITDTEGHVEISVHLKEYISLIWPELRKGKEPGIHNRIVTNSR
uniref:Uncharacterized protein n=1 Tax=Anguilla anguilla TaxID=7936 RepID=A0A0E9SNK1_ANGAN